MSVLCAEGLTARYPTQPASSPALLDVDLRVEQGERLLLLGPNGAGKSTFLRVFAGLMRASRGKALIEGVPASAARAHVGVVSHATYLYDELTAAENLRFYAELYGVAAPAQRTAELLDQVGMAHLADVSTGRLSRGQQQRVAIARAFLHDPPVLLLDEPDTGLDLGAFGLLERLVTAHARTLVLTTHNLAAGLRLGTRVCVLSGGKVVYTQAHISSDDAPALTARLEQLSRA